MTKPVDPKEKAIPEGEPLFLDPKAVKEANYVSGVDPFTVTPVFDDEIQQLGLNENAGTEIPAGVRIRYLEVARLTALGRTSAFIADRLNYSPSQVNKILRRPDVMAEVHRYRDKLYEQDLATAMKDLGPDAMNVITQMLHDPNEKLKDRTETAKWLLEKLTGKPKQEIAHESNTLAVFMELVQKMNSNPAAPRLTPASDPNTIDVTPSEVPTEAPPVPEPGSKWANWSKTHL